MRKTVTLTYPASPDRVSRMLASPDYQRSRIDGLGLEGVGVDCAPRGDGFVVTLTGTVPVERLPAAARGFVRGPLEVKVTESWGAPSDEGARSGNLDVALRGAPGRMSAVTSLSPGQDGAASHLVLDVSVEVGIPLLGRRVEQTVLGALDGVLADEERRAAAWLTSR